MVLLDQMRKEVLRLEAKVERLQTELAVTTASLDTLKKQLKVMRRRLFPTHASALMGIYFLRCSTLRRNPTSRNIAHAGY